MNCGGKTRAKGVR